MFYNRDWNGTNHNSYRVQVQYIIYKVRKLCAVSISTLRYLHTEIFFNFSQNSVWYFLNQGPYIIIMVSGLPHIHNIDLWLTKLHDEFIAYYSVPFRLTILFWWVLCHLAHVTTLLKFIWICLGTHKADVRKTCVCVRSTYLLYLQFLNFKYLRSKTKELIFPAKHNVGVKF